MLRLAVTTQAETFERMQEPLQAHDIDVTYLPTTGTVFDITAQQTSEFDVGFVYPSRLMEGAVVNAIESIPWVNDRAAIVTSRNKAAVLTRLRQSGIDVPESKLLSHPVDTEQIVDAARTLGFPLIVKPNSATQGRGVTKVHDVDSLVGTLDYLNVIHTVPTTADKSVLLQEFIPEARDIRVMVLDGTIVGAVERSLSAAQRNRDRWKHNVHRGATPVATTVSESTKQVVRNTARTLNIPYLGVDLLQTSEMTYVSETNARPTIDAAGKYVDTFWEQLANLIKRTTT
jgi:ribosomal protein S6--L-glutamate ligase